MVARIFFWSTEYMLQLHLKITIASQIDGILYKADLDPDPDPQKKRTPDFYKKRTVY